MFFLLKWNKRRENFFFLYSPQDPLLVVEYFDFAGNKLAYRCVSLVYVFDCLLLDECERHVVDRLEKI